MEDEKEIITAEEAAEYLRIAMSTLYRFVQENRIPCFKVGRSWRFKRSLLERWIEGIASVKIEGGVSAKEVGKMKEGEHKAKASVDVSLGGVVKGLGSLIDLVAELTEKAEKFQGEVVKEGEVEPLGEKGLKAVYGFSVRIGGEGRPTIQSFGNVREKRGKGPVVDEVREPIADLFDEEDHILVVVELPGADEPAVKYELKEDVLIVAAESGDRKYYKELLLPTPVDAGRISASCKNGILELKLWKTKAA